VLGNAQTGDVLGYVGNTGNARGTPLHLHYGIYCDGA
jgi:murein DD-endopeptidase MepM/ murein hydrolase activator NlpD